MRTRSSSTFVGAVALASLAMLGLAEGQDNPLDPPPPQNPLEKPPEWCGIYAEADPRGAAVLLVPGGSQGAVAGILVVRANRQELELTGTIGSDGAIQVTHDQPLGGKRKLSFRVQGDELVITSDGAEQRLARVESGRKAVKAWKELQERGGMGGARQAGNEAAAIGALKTLSTAQVLFREGDKDQDGQLDYGTLEELAKTQIIDAVLGSGTKQGYRFECRPSAKTPEFLWAATATPVDGVGPGRRAFVVNHAGVIYESTTKAFSLADLGDEMKIPDGAAPLGRSPGRAPAPPPPPEAGAIGALKTLATSQSLFREGDKEGDGELDYGSLAELKKAQLIDDVLGSGTKNGYRFECGASPKTPEFLWCATATPVDGVSKERRAFFVNQAGVIHYSTRRAFVLGELVERCEVPKWAGVVGGPEPEEKR